MIANLQAHYGFTCMPFTASVPASSLFASAAHKEAVARLRWLISARGLGVLTGEVGAGKTGKAPCFYTADLIPQVEAALAAEADERNRNVILAIDESHMLTGDQLEAVRMITNHNLDSGSPLTVLLIGQPTLRRRLRVGDMAALDQRVQLRCVIPSPAVTAAEADGYLRAHLAHAGRSDTLFSDDAVRVIHSCARGMPRAINRLATTALLAACTAGKTIADESSARTAIAEDAAAATD